jgi:hypothetical protein
MASSAARWWRAPRPATSLRSKRATLDNPALPKYAEIGRRFAMQKGLNGVDARRFLVDTLRRWEAELDLPRLSAYGIGEDDLARIVAASRGGSMKTNPIVLSDAELTHILASPAVKSMALW